jgi:excisionase family DNA binding protein
MMDCSIRWLRLREACAYAGLSRNTVKKMLLDGSLIGERTSKNGHWRVDRESIDDWFGSGQKKAVAIARSLGL